MNTMHPHFMNFAYNHNVNPHLSPVVLGFLAVLVVWSLIWKGLALWKSARNHQKAWFIVMLILNSLGILEIIYLVWFQKNKNNLVHTTTVTETHTVTASTPAPATAESPSTDMSSSVPPSAI